MDFSSITGVSYNAANTSKASTAAERITNSANSLNSESSEEELKGVLKDFESYFVEQMLKEMKDTFTHQDKEDEDPTMAQYKDIYMDKVIETMADKVVDDMGENITQQLYEQMKRNYHIGE